MLYMQNTILAQAQAIAKSGEDVDLEYAQQILMDHLITHPQDTDAWLLLIRIECNTPFDDPERIMHYVQHVLSYDPSNAYALLYWSYADYFLMGNLNNELYDNLCMAQSDDIEIMSMIEVAKARYFQHRDPRKYEEALKKSIEYCSTHVTNCRKLGRLYIRQGRIQEGEFLVDQSLQNSENTQNIKRAFNHSEVTRGVRCTNLRYLLDKFFAGI
jgi:hypothetical protein